MPSPTTVGDELDDVIEPIGRSRLPTAGRRRAGRRPAGRRRRRPSHAMSPSLRRRRSRPRCAAPDDAMTLTEHLARAARPHHPLRARRGARRDRDHRLLRPGARLPRSSRTRTSASGAGPTSASCARDGGVQLFIFDPLEGFTTRLRVGTYGGLILALPVILWQIWRFIVPALHAKEKRTRSRSSSARSAVPPRRVPRLPDAREGARVPHLVGRRRRPADVPGQPSTSASSG